MTTQVSKTLGFAVLAPQDAAVAVSKTVAYAVLSTEARVAVSKVVAYAVIKEETATVARPSFFVTT